MLQTALGAQRFSRAKSINLCGQRSLWGFHPQRHAVHYHDCMCLFVPWVAPAWIKPIIIVLLFKLRSVLYIHILSHKAIRVECIGGWTKGHLDFRNLGGVTLVASTLIFALSQSEFTGRTGLSSVIRVNVWAHVELARWVQVLKSFMRHNSSQAQ